MRNVKVKVYAELSYDEYDDNVVISPEKVIGNAWEEMHNDGTVYIKTMKVYIDGKLVKTHLPYD